MLLHSKHITIFFKNDRGASAIMISIVIAMLLGFSVLAIDVGYLYATRNELQNVADAAALAGANELGKIYLSIPESAQSTYNANSDADGNSVNDITQIKTASRDVSFLNEAAKKNIDISFSDVTIGKWDWDGSPDQAMANDYIRPDAVRVIARRDSTLNNSVSTFFGFIFSFFGGAQNAFNVSAVATAALSGPANVAEGTLKAPFGISEQILNSCPTVIQFSPTTDSCAGWHNFFDPMNADAAAEKAINLIEGFVDDNGNDIGHQWLEDHYNILSSQAPSAEEVPTASIGDTFEFQGGVIAKLFASGGYYPNGSWDDYGEAPPGDVVGNDKKPVPFINLFDFYRFRDGDGGATDVVYACDPATGGYGDKPANEVWSTTVPVYKDPGGSCSNPSGTTEIVGFANVIIVMPNPPPDNTVNVCFSCADVIEPGRGGGGAVGNVLGSLPNLVQ
jgi:hypothetical protein